MPTTAPLLATHYGTNSLADKNWESRFTDMVRRQVSKSRSSIGWWGRKRHCLTTMSHRRRLPGCASDGGPAIWIGHIGRDPDCGATDGRDRRGRRLEIDGDDLRASARERDCNAAPIHARNRSQQQRDADGSEDLSFHPFCVTPGCLHRMWQPAWLVVGRWEVAAAAPCHATLEERCRSHPTPDAHRYDDVFHAAPLPSIKAWPTRRAPVMPYGCPMEIPPPFTL